ncbi:LacI family DNA-binding transcriptional regulator [Clostridium phoceensis]|uniref:LacI family DNA-binding transcriptional regulator n=1 Tax=Clostridium phoceensis TaxID=1650661 RepID=UPI00097D5100|nr:LacI family DNA-binding transcriptional regulator [Clostridium phoceensis]
MDKKTTIKDVAALCRVSIATVSRVFSNSSSVDPAIAEKVKAAALQLNYRPNLAAQAMRRKSANQIAIVVPSLLNSYHADIVAGAIAEADQCDQNVIVKISDFNPKTESECFDSLTNAFIDGILFLPTSGHNPIARFPQFQTLPHVIIGRRNFDSHASHVCVDNIATGYIATQYLLRLNRRRIALLINLPIEQLENKDSVEIFNLLNSKSHESFSIFDRFSGYQTALKEGGVNFDSQLLIPCGLSEDTLLFNIQRVLGQQIEFDAILAPQVNAAIQIIRFLSSQGIDIPRDVSIISFTGGPLANISKPSVTTISSDYYELGRSAVHQLNSLIRNGAVSEIVYPVNLEIRQSTLKKIKANMEKD